MRDPINSTETVIRIPYLALGILCLVLAAVMMILMLFVFQNPYSVWGVINYTVAGLLIMAGMFLIFREMDARTEEWKL